MGAEGFEAFFATEYVRVVRTVFLVVHDQGQAEELAQDAFVQLLRHWSKIAASSNPAPGYGGSRSGWRCGRRNASEPDEGWSVAPRP